MRTTLRSIPRNIPRSIPRSIPAPPRPLLLSRKPWSGPRGKTPCGSRRRRSLAAIVLMVAPWLPGAADATTYKVDPTHTSVTFQIRHLFTHVDGRFKTFGGTIAFDPAHPEQTKITGTVEATSIDTNVAKRDDHLRSADFFDVATYPTITFESTKVTDVDAGAKKAKVHGNLTIRGVTKPIVLDASFLGAAADPWGNKKAGFAAETEINRTDFGLKWNQALETGGVLVGEEVKIRINVEADVQD